jgi:hypothetical protein
MYNAIRVAKVTNTNIEGNSGTTVTLNSAVSVGTATKSIPLISTLIV